MDMVSKVKAAIRDAAVPHQGGTIAGAPAVRSLSYYASVGIDYFSHDPSRLEALFDIAARAALEAMREPTEAMLKASLGPEVFDGHLGYTTLTETDAKEVWQAMHSAAFPDQPRPAEEKA